MGIETKLKRSWLARLLMVATFAIAFAVVFFLHLIERNTAGFYAFAVGAALAATMTRPYKCILCCPSCKKRLGPIAVGWWN